MDQAIANALKEKKELEERLARVNQFLALYEEFSGTEGEAFDIRSIRPPGNTPVLDVPRDVSPGQVQEEQKVERGRKLSPAELVRLATGALKDIGKPLTRGALVEVLEARGALLPGSTKEIKGRYLGTIMWRNQKQFENIEGKGYWLRGRPVPLTPTDVLQLKLEDEAARLP